MAKDLVTDELVETLGQARELLRELHGVIKDLKQERKAAEAVRRDIIATIEEVRDVKQLRAAVSAMINEVFYTPEGIADVLKQPITDLMESLERVLDRKLAVTINELAGDTNVRLFRRNWDHQ